MKLAEIKNRYEHQGLEKQEFIDLMHDKHRILFEYAEFMKGTEIEKITITDDSLIMTSRAGTYHKGDVSFYVDILDKRVTPIEAFNFGRYEQEDSEMIYRIVEKDYTVLDIGGNIGWYTNHIAALLEIGKIYAFEPIPETFEKLERNVQLNGFTNIVLNNFAFSDKQDKIKFYYSPTMPGAASAANITENSQMQELECTTTTVDSFVLKEAIVKIDFIKCDVEGAELMVFRGALQTIEKHMPIVFTEMLRKWAAKFNYHPNDIIHLFKSFGYRCFVVQNNTLQLIDRVNDRTLETNFLFMHPELHHKKIAQLTGSDNQTR
jgi:FkbM family methyltransferase